MNIQFQYVTPSPLDGIVDEHSEIWDKHITFDNKKRYAIVAPSGKGKSTFVHFIYGLRHDYKGLICIDGKNINSFSADCWAELRQKKISIVFQDLRLFLNLTPIENILLKVSLGAFTAMRKIEEYFHQLHIEHTINKPCKLLSYGERQRVAILRALVQPFDCLLLDEPFSHLDKSNAERASAIISAECAARGAGYIITSLNKEMLMPTDIQYTL